MEDKSIQAIQKKSTNNAGKRRVSVIVADEEEFRQRQHAENNNETKIELTSWKDSSLIKICPICKEKFTLMNRKHHCRQCGGVFCGKCSSYQLVIGGDLKRACLNCYKAAVNVQENVSLGFKHSYQPFHHFDQGATTTTTSGRKEIRSDESVATTRESDASIKSVDDLPAWADGILFISKYGENDPKVSQFPSDVFSEQFISDVVINSMPKSLSSSSIQDEKFLFRLRQKSSYDLEEEDDDSNNNDYIEKMNKNSNNRHNHQYRDLFYNCYVSYQKKSRSKSDGIINQHSIVFVSRWSFPQLAFRLLSKLDEALYFQLSQINHQEELLSIASNMLMVAFGQVMLWPNPTSNSSIYLPFLGEMLQYDVIPDIWMAFYGGITLLPSQWIANLIALLGPLGLLRHMWTIWELVVTGQDILVYATSPAQCSEFTIALSTVLAPLNFLGDIRPHISSGDSDIDNVREQAIRNQSYRKTNQDQASRENRKYALIVGTSDTKVVETLNIFGVAIFLKAPVPGSADIDTVYLGLRQRHNALFRLLSQTNSNNNSNTGTNSNINISNPTINISNPNSNPNSNPSTTTTNETISSVLSEWWNKDRDYSMIVSSVEPSAIRDLVIIRKVKLMGSKERLILGEKLLRDNLSTLTLSYLKPADDISAEASDLKAARNYRKKLIALKEERLKRLSQKPKATGILGYIDELSIVLRTSPDTCLDNVPTIIMWCGYGVVVGIYSLIGLPLVALVALLFVFKIPVLVPTDVEELMKMYIPEPILYPRKQLSMDSSSLDGSKVLVDIETTKKVQSNQNYSPVDLSGIWKRTRCINYENFLGAQGVGYVQRRLATNISMTHTITMDNDLTAFRLQEKAGPINSDNLYEINPDKSKNTLLGKKEFMDKVYWDEKGVLTIQKIHIPEKDYEITVKRYLEDLGKTIRLVGTYKDLSSSGNKIIETTCYFEKIGSSPNDPPKSYTKPVTSSTTSISVKKLSLSSTSLASVSKKRYKNFSGVWQRVKAVNFEEFVGVQGAGYVQRKLAAAMPLTHTIIMDSSLKAFRLKETGGPLDLDNSYTIGNDFIETKILKKEFKDKVYWVGPETLILHRVSRDNTFELVMTRKFYDDGKQIILTSVHRDLRTMNEIEATSWFHKTGNVPNTLTPPVPIPLPPDAKIDLEEDGLNTLEGEEEDDDDDADDDALALRKHRVKSSHRQSSLMMKLSMIGGFSDQVLDSLPTELNDAYIGTWDLIQTLNVDAVGTQSSENLLKSMKSWHVIEFPSTTSVRLMELSGNQIIMDKEFEVGSDFITTQVQGKTYREKVYMEGQALVHQRLHHYRDFEYRFKRYLEDDGNTIRLVTIFKNLIADTEAESISMYKKRL